MPITRRLTVLAAMVLLVASSSPAVGGVSDVSDVAVVANALEPTRTSIPRIATSEPATVIRDDSVSSTGAIPMYATIGAPSRKALPTLPPLREEPIPPPVDPKEPATVIESIEQRTYTVDARSTVADVQLGLVALFALQGLDSTPQMSLSADSGSAVMLFVESEDDIVAVVTLSTSGDGSAVEATWTDR